MTPSDAPKKSVPPLASLDVSLEEQIDQLLAILSGPNTGSAAAAKQLQALLDSARRVISSGNSQGNLIAARAHLMNFSKSVQRLIERGETPEDKGALLLDGGEAILEQIEGNHPVRQSHTESENSEGFAEDADSRRPDRGHRH
ncbi:MAG TPA: hypothetical protein VFR18_21055 [Terriglobia bacterium]|nr:hypothetical protein [Terriglobia bacterium]